MMPFFIADDARLDLVKDLVPLTGMPLRMSLLGVYLTCVSCAGLGMPCGPFGVPKLSLIMAFALVQGTLGRASVHVHRWMA